MSMMPLALHDALNNQQRQGATVVVTLHSGQIKGHLKQPASGGYHGQETVLVETTDGGWQTIRIEAIEAVGVIPR